MRVTKAILQQRIDDLEERIRDLLRDRIIEERDRARDYAREKHQLAERLLTIFERTAGEAQLRLSGSGASAATNLEREKQETYKLQRGIRA